MDARIAVIGCGYWGINLVRNFAALGSLVAVADANTAAADGAASRFSVPARRVDEILADPEITGVVIAVPAALHAAVALESLRAGKDVFVEKPLALDLREAQEMCDMAAAKDRVLMVGHLLQYHPAFLRLRGLVRAGELGKLQYVYSNRLNFGRIRREENSLWSFAPHDLSMILSLIGRVPSGVLAVGSSYLQKAVADTTTTHLRFPGGEGAHVYVSWLHPFKEQKLVVVGDRGMAVFDDGQPWERKLLVYRHQIEWRDGLPVPSKAEPEAVEIEQAEPLQLECEHFLECMRTRAVPRTDGAEGLGVLRVLAAAERSMRSGVEERLDESATGDEPMVHESAYVDPDVELGPRTRVWHFSHVLNGSVIGADCVLGQNVMVGPDVRVGDRCKIQNNVSLYKGVTLEDGVFCGPSAVFTNVNNPRAEIERKAEFRPTYVGRGATIGANATIVCGHRIGAYSFVAAGAVVTSDVPDHALMAGVPARRIGWMSHDGERLGPDLVCPRSGRRYEETAGGLVEVQAPPV